MSGRGSPPGAPATPGAGHPVGLTGMAAFSAYGRGARPLLDAALAGRPAFRAVDRFDTAGRRVRTAATAPGAPDLGDELVHAIEAAIDQAGLGSRVRARCPLLVAVHGDPHLARAGENDRSAHSAGAFARRLATACGLAPPRGVYTGACVAASTAVADAAATIASGRADRVVVAAGYLVDPDQFALFDAGRALSTDGQVRPFSTGRRGLLLGDGIAAAVVESCDSARRRNAPLLARLAGWGRSGDAWHVVQPRPDGDGMARAIRAALRRAGISPGQLGYVNAHGSGTAASDAAETRALGGALGDAAGQIPVSSTKSVHGQALEASGLLELVVTVSALHAGRLPVNAGFLGRDPDCQLDLVLDRARNLAGQYALSLNAALGGGNTALLVGAA